MKNIKIWKLSLFFFLYYLHFPLSLIYTFNKFATVDKVRYLENGVSYLYENRIEYNNSDIEWGSLWRTFH